MDNKRYKRMTIINIIMFWIMIIFFAIGSIYVYVLPAEENIVIIGENNNYINNLPELFNYWLFTTDDKINDISRECCTKAIPMASDLVNCNYMVEGKTFSYDVYRNGNECQGIATYEEKDSSFSNNKKISFLFYAVKEGDKYICWANYKDKWYKASVAASKDVLYNFENMLQNIDSVSFNQYPVISYVTTRPEDSPISCFPHNFDKINIAPCGHVESITKDSVKYYNFGRWGDVELFTNLMPPEGIKVTEGWTFMQDLVITPHLCDSTN